MNFIIVHDSIKRPVYINVENILWFHHSGCGSGTAFKLKTEGNQNWYNFICEEEFQEVKKLLQNAGYNFFGKD